MQLVIKPIEGKMLLDQRAALAGQKRYHGYSPTGEPRQRMVSRASKPVLVPTFEWSDGAEETVTETNDGFYRQAILAGDCEYVKHGDGTREVALVAATTRNRKAREAQAAAEREAAEEAKRAHELALEAAERGDDLEPEKAEPAKPLANDTTETAARAKPAAKPKAGGKAEEKV